MRIGFLFPAALWLLLLMLPLWALAYFTPRQRAPIGQWASLAIRTLIIISLVLALAGMRIVRNTADLTTVFLLDRSDSIGPAERAQADAFVRDAIAAQRPGDRSAVVAFGANALVERMPSQPAGSAARQVAPAAIGTNIQQAVELGLALLPAEMNKRLVLLSDGGENTGDARAAARLAAARGVPLSYVDLGLGPQAPEALVSELQAPSVVRDGQTFQLVATIESSVAQAAHLRILGDGKPVAEQDVKLQPGVNRVPIQAHAGGAGFQRYRAELTPRQDRWAANNTAEAVVGVQGTPNVLLVEGVPGDAENLRRALVAAKFAVAKVAPSKAPGDLGQLSKFDAVVLINVPANQLPAPMMKILPTYVRDLGKGLVMIGGDQSFGVGGYADTPIESILPVQMDVPQYRERPSIAIAYVLDKSSSMSGCHCMGPDRGRDGYFDDKNPFSLDIAKESVKRSLEVLDPRDTVSVIMFDQQASLSFAPKAGPSVDEVMGKIAKIKPIGGTNVSAGLELAVQTLQQSKAKVKHIILYTDGIGHGGDAIAQAQAFARQGGTLSVVAEGYAATDYLKKLAIAGAGRYIQVDDTPRDVPRIFLRETLSVTSKFIVEHPFFPRYGAETPIFKNLKTGLPKLYGYNGATPKKTATVGLTDKDGSPILAQWQYGLGRTVAWMSDTKGQWAIDWVGWPGFPRFGAQLVGWVLPTAMSNVNVVARPFGPQTQVEITLPSPELSRAGLDLRATMVAPNGAKQALPLSAQAPGVYRATIPTPPQNTYMLQVVGTRGAQVLLQETATLVVPYSAEYRPNQHNPALLAALAQVTGGSRLAQHVEAFAPVAQGTGSAQEIALPLLLLALALLPLDLLARRLMVFWRSRAA